MRIFAIGDLHLAGGLEKPMDVFGPKWKNHPERIRRGWLARVQPDDAVLVPGDLSWANDLDEAKPDLAYLAELPGTIILIRGNHDYWWSAIGRVRRALPPNVCAIQNDHVLLPDGTAICGSRGWVLPGSEGFDEHDARIYRREVERLKLSVQHAAKSGAERLIAMLHYPPLPIGNPANGSELSEVLEQAGVRVCVYGHLHDEAQQRRAFNGVWRGVMYRLVACDAIDFAPVQVWPQPSGEGRDATSPK
ncbi:MAG TPA: metallophosphoesterase [Limnochordia bacterium]